jgi:gliding motility-associated peptidyl-prolyl isomerase
MLKSYIYIITIALLAWSCKTPEARRPVKTTSGSYINTSVERNKKMIAEEEKEILAIIELDTINTILNSEHGFWYYFNKKNTIEEEKADFGDIVEFEYEIKDLEGNTIYSKHELGKQTYHMDKEELITGLREGLKLLNEGETATFYFPSHKAYGYYGDLNRIGTNMPIVTTVTILNIKQIN